jgi:hypothetical protein
MVPDLNAESDHSGSIAFSCLPVIANLSLRFCNVSEGGMGDDVDGRVDPWRDT